MNSPPILEPILVVGLVDVHWGLTDLDFEKPMAKWALLFRAHALNGLPAFGSGRFSHSELFAVRSQRSCLWSDREIGAQEAQQRETEGNSGPTGCGSKLNQELDRRF